MVDLQSTEFCVRWSRACASLQPWLSMFSAFSALFGRIRLETLGRCDGYFTPFTFFSKNAPSPKQTEQRMKTAA